MNQAHVFSLQPEICWRSAGFPNTKTLALISLALEEVVLVG